MDASIVKDIKSIDFEAIIPQAYSWVKSINSWSHNRSHKEPASVVTEIYTTTHEKDFWVGRVTKLNEKQTETYKSKFDRYLIGEVPINSSDNHTTREKEYMHDLYDYKIEPVNDNCYLTKTFYKLPFPLSKRTFHDIIYIHKTAEYSMVISIPISTNILGSDEGVVVGMYISVELVEVIDGKLTWSMCTCSDPNGNVPYFITKLGVPGATCKDVPSFLLYCDAK